MLERLHKRLGPKRYMHLGIQRVYSIPIRAAEYCYQHICMSVSLRVYM